MGTLGQRVSTTFLTRKNSHNFFLVLLTGFEPRVFGCRVRRSNHCAAPPPAISLQAPTCYLSRHIPTGPRVTSHVISLQAHVLPLTSYPYKSTCYPSRHIRTSPRVTSHVISVQAHVLPLTSYPYKPMCYLSRTSPKWTSTDSIFNRLF